MQRVGQFEAFIAKSGVPTAAHIPSGVLVHSAIDPLREASNIAKRLLNAPGHTITLIGPGLGYLSSLLRDYGRNVHSVEVFPEVDALARQCIQDRQDPYSEGHEKALPLGAVQVYIAPYVSALSDLLPEEVRRFVNELRVGTASQSNYRPLIAANEAENAELVTTIRRLAIEECASNKPVVVVGAGPSLNWCPPALRSLRADVLIVAASGAVPCLSDAGIVPDWTIALEAQATVARDLDSLPNDSRVVVFPWTNPEVLSSERWSIAIAGNDFVLNTAGGTTALTAADFATKISRGQLFLVGIDLSNAQGSYAFGALRDNVSRAATAPKFGVMRDRFESWLRDQAPRVINHVLPAGGCSLRGSRHILPHDLKELLCRSLTDIRESESV